MPRTTRTYVMVEAESDEVCEKYVDEVIEVIKAKGHIA